MLVGRTTITDAAGRTFKDMSAYGYAFWSGDTRMRRMMEQYMDEDSKAKAKAYEECKQMEDKGVSFTFQGEMKTHSKHFDFQPLLNAYQAFLAEANSLDVAGNWNNEAWARAEELWLNIGKEQAKVPTHVAQEYCSDCPFHPLPTFKEPDLKRTVKFYNRWADRTEPWEFSGVHSGVGSGYPIYKVGASNLAFAIGGAARASSGGGAVTWILRPSQPYVRQEQWMILSRRSKI